MMEQQMEAQARAEEQRPAREGIRRRGFASMNPERQRMIASAGGRAAHARGTAHEFTSEEGRRAARARLRRVQQ